MFKILRARWQQKYRTLDYPDGPPPTMPDLFAGRPVLGSTCPEGCRLCAEACPTGAIMATGPRLDTGRCLFCRACEKACPEKSIEFSSEHQLSAASRQDLTISSQTGSPASALCQAASKHFRRSFHLRQVSAGGCGACEADCNVLGTPVWDMGRFGIKFVASPRHADGLLITGPVTSNMREALLKTWEAVPDPKVVIAAGACAISGGPYIDHPEAANGAESVVPVDLNIPGCPPHPLTILDGLLRMLGYPVD